MGKSNKKLKSERINTLRKQYDAFLEEDKKRKERNEYILGRLDKMRYSTSLVPVRDKQSMSHISRAADVYSVRCSENIPLSRDLQTPINSQQIFQNKAQIIDETNILQEISKNYILIPKLRSTFTNHYRQQATPVNELSQVKDVQNTESTGNTSTCDIDNNWQSKYDILNILKKEEKETLENATKHTPVTFSPNAFALNNNNFERRGTICDNLITDITSEKVNNYLDELPEKDVSVEEDYVSLTHNDENKDYTQCHSIIHDGDSLVFPSVTTEVVDVIDHKLQNTNLKGSESKATAHEITGDITKYTENEDREYNSEINDLNIHSEQTHYEEQIDPINNIHEMASKQCVEINEEQSNNLTYVPEIPANQILSMNPTNKTHVDEQLTNPEQIINSGSKTEIDTLNALNSNFDLSNAGDVSVVSSPKHNDGQVVHMVAVDGKEPPTETLSEDQNTAADTERVDDIEIQAFDHEQREMFYMEQPGEEFNAQDNLNVNEQEYTQNEAENQDQYSYYDNVQSEAYPVNLDLNEDQTLRYDPTYQQQYVDSYEKSYESQQYEVEQVDNQINPEEMEQLQEQEIKEMPQDIESTLDAEEGYVMQQQYNQNIVEPPEKENRQT